MSETSGHDPLLDAWLCGLDDDPNYSDYLTLVVRVREDERRRNDGALIGTIVRGEALRDAVEAVRALPRPLRKTRIVAAIEGLSRRNRPTEPAQANSYPLSASADSSADAGERRHHGGK